MPTKVKKKRKKDYKKHRLVGKTRVDDPELELVWIEFKETGDERLRNILIEQYLALVRYIAERILVKLPQNVELRRGLFRLRFESGRRLGCTELELFLGNFNRGCSHVIVLSCGASPSPPLSRFVPTENCRSKAFSGNSLGRIIAAA